MDLNHFITAKLEGVYYCCMVWKLLYCQILRNDSVVIKKIQDKGKKKLQICLKILSFPANINICVCKFTIKKKYCINLRK